MVLMSTARNCHRAAMKIYRVCLIGLTMAAPLVLAEDASPALSLRDSNGKQQNLSDYRGKIVVLNFWATWCVPCRNEMPMLSKIQKKYHDKGIELLGASLDEEKSQPLISPFAEKYKIPFPLLLGATPEDLKKLNLGEAIPATAFIDADGKVVARVLGELDKSDLEHRIEWMLGNHRGSEPAPFVNGFNKKKSEPAPTVLMH